MNESSNSGNEHCTDGTDRSENIRKHTRSLNSAMSFMDWNEHITWELGEAVDPVEYPLKVSVTIEVRSVDTGTDQEEA